MTKHAKSWVVCFSAQNLKWYIARNEWQSSEFLGPNGEHFSVPYYYNSEADAKCRLIPNHFLSLISKDL